MPFRDAGYSQADFVIGIQDVVYGVWKAKEAGLCGFKNFSLEEYFPYLLYTKTSLIKSKVREI